MNIQTESTQRAITILFVSAEPGNLKRLRLAEELREIKRALRRSNLRSLFNLEVCLAARPEDLLEEMDDVKPDIVHFSGHGSDKGEFFLQDESGKASATPAHAFQSLFQRFTGETRCVILNSCTTEFQMNAIALTGIHAIGTISPISDKAAIAFSARFYKVLGDKLDLSDAFDLAKEAMEFTDPASRNTMALTAAPGGLSFKFDQRKLAAQAPPVSLVNGGNGANPVIDENRATLASTFLSYSTEDQALVSAVASELVRRGVLPWMDKTELDAGVNLTTALGESVNQQATLTAFVSTDAIKSQWFEHELSAAFQKEDNLNSHDLVMPVFLGDRETLVRASDILRTRWFRPDSRLVSTVGIQPNATDDLPIQAREIATGLASSIYRKLRIEDANDVVIYLDQRGENVSRGKTNIPEKILQLSAPTLVFRTNLDARSEDKIVAGPEWDELRDTVKWALGRAMPDLRGQHMKRIHLAGNAQLGLAYLIGHHFDRTTNTELHCTGRFGDVFTNEGQDRLHPLSGGNPNETPHPKIPSISDRSEVESISLLLCTDDEGYIGTVLRHLAAKKSSPPPVWIRHEKRLNSSLEVMGYIANVVAVLRRLVEEKGLRTVHLFTSLPFHALPLLAANLKTFVVNEVVFMEYRRDLLSSNPKPKDLYSPLRF